MAETEFKAGDLVMLKAGGPVMVVDRVFERESYSNESTTYRCTWFSGAKHNREDFHEEALMLSEEE